MILIDFSEWRPAGQGAAHGAGRSFWYISQCPFNKFGFFIGERPKSARGMIFTPAAVTRRRIKKQKWRGGGKCSSRIPKKKFSNAWPVSGISPITERLSLLVYYFITFTADSDRILPFVGRVGCCWPHCNLSRCPPDTVPRDQPKQKGNNIHPIDPVWFSTHKKSFSKSITVYTETHTKLM